MTAPALPTLPKLTSMLPRPGETSRLRRKLRHNRTVNDMQRRRNKRLAESRRAAVQAQMTFAAALTVVNAQRFRLARLLSHRDVHPLPAVRCDECAEIAVLFGGEGRPATRPAPTAIEAGRD